MVGSVLAAVGTALPETILPLVAIAAGHASGKEIGIGAILGAPFMLSTLAMFVIGVSVLYFARGGRRSRDVRGDRRVLLQDLGYFLVMYTLAVVGGLYHPKWYKWTLAAILLVGYVIYVIRHFQSPAGKTEEAEATGEVRPLYLLRMVRRLQGRREEGDGDRKPPLWWGQSFTKTQYAKEFIQVHETVCRVLDIVGEEGLLHSANDNSGYYDSRSWKDASQRVNEELSFAQAMSGVFGLAVGNLREDGVPVQVVEDNASKAKPVDFSQALAREQEEEASETRPPPDSR